MNKDKKIEVLLVEDITSDAQAITRAISYGDIEETYSVIRVSRLKEGIKFLNEQNHNVSVILLDLSLPDAKDIKALVEFNILFPGLPVIVVSDQTDERVMKRAMLNGASRFLPKSEASGVLIRKIVADVIDSNNKQDVFS